MPSGPVKTLQGRSLHAMGDLLQLRHITIRCREILNSLDEFIKTTEKSVPGRVSNFRLQRDTGGSPGGKRQEAVLERDLWRQWGGGWSRGDTAFLTDHCLYLQSYQVPLQRVKKDSWGDIDLLGVSPGLLPVVVELKTGNAKDTPLRVIVQGTAYAIALRKLWLSRECRFREEWRECMGVACVPEEPRSLTVVCVAPREYWRRVKGECGPQGNVPVGAWPLLRNIIRELHQRGFTIVCAELESSQGRLGASEVAL